MDEASSTWHPPLALPHEAARNGCTSCEKLTVAGIVHPGGTTTLASPPPPDACPASGGPPEELPPELLLLLEPPTVPEPLLEPPLPVPLSSSAGVIDPLLEEPTPIDGEPPLEDEVPPLAVPPLELLDEPLLVVWLSWNPDDEPPPPVAALTGWLVGWELQALQTPAPTTTNRPTRCERARRFMSSISLAMGKPGLCHVFARRARLRVPPSACKGRILTLQTASNKRRPPRHRHNLIASSPHRLIALSTHSRPYAFSKSANNFRRGRSPPCGQASPRHSARLESPAAAPFARARNALAS